MVRVIVEKGADQESEDNRYDRTPLRWAAEKLQAQTLSFASNNSASLIIQ